MLAFFRRLGLLGQDGTGRGEGLVVVVRVVQIHELKSQQKTIAASRNGQQKGNFFKLQ
jgi:hypothetical protein